MSEATDGGVRCCRGRLHGVFSCFLPLDFMCIVFDGLLRGFYTAHFQIPFCYPSAACVFLSSGQLRDRVPAEVESSVCVYIR